MKPELTFASSVLLWFRQDLPRDAAQAYWRGPHAQIVARSPGFMDYRQHHFAQHNPGSWPAITGVETAIPEARKIDGMPEVILAHVLAPQADREQHTARVFADEANVFARTILYLTTPGAGRRYLHGERGTVRARDVILLRRRPDVAPEVFAQFIDTMFAPTLVANDAVRELNTQLFDAWDETFWDSPGVSHDNAPSDQFQASVVLGFESAEARTQFYAAEDVKALEETIRLNCAAVHAYVVEATYADVVDGRVRLPQWAPEARPALDPVERILPPPPPRATQTSSSEPFPPSQTIALLSPGPEDVVATHDGWIIYAGADGSIVRLDPSTLDQTVLGTTQGRPLGLEALPDGRVLICDAHLGLLRFDPATGKIEDVVQYVDDIPLRFCSNVTAARDGTYWFTESTSRFDFEHFAGAMLEHRGSGRLFKRLPSGEVETVLDQLHFANGVTLTDDESAVIFAETDGYTLNRLWISGPKAGIREIIADNLPGFPDNISRCQDGQFWVAYPDARRSELDRAGQIPGWLRQMAWANAPAEHIRSNMVWLMKFDVEGQVLADLQTTRENFGGATGIAQCRGRLFVVGPECENMLVIDMPA